MADPRLLLLRNKNILSPIILCLFYVGHMAFRAMLYLQGPCISSTKKSDEQDTYKPCTYPLYLYPRAPGTQLRAVTEVASSIVAQCYAQSNEACDLIRLTSSGQSSSEWGRRHFFSLWVVVFFLALLRPVFVRLPAVILDMDLVITTNLGTYIDNTISTSTA